MGIYGSQSTPVSKTAMAKLRSAVASVASPGAARGRSVLLSLEVGQKAVIGPCMHVAACRIVAIRRAWYKQPWLRQSIERAMQ
eukprot:15441454-Alexandrium_andersonii.AAC.1